MLLPPHCVPVGLGLHVNLPTLMRLCHVRFCRLDMVFFREGYCRLALQEYNLSNLEDRYVWSYVPDFAACPQFTVP